MTGVFVSLESGLRLFSTIFLNTFFVIIFLILYLIPGIPVGVPLFLSIVYTLHVSAVWIYLLYEIFVAEILIQRITGIRIIVLYIFTILQYTFWHSIVLAFNPSAFTGIDPGASAGRRFLISLFVSVESVSSLGSGAIIANSDGAFVSVGFNAVHGTMFLTLAVPMLLSIFFQRHKFLKTLR